MTKSKSKSKSRTQTRLEIVSPSVLSEFQSEMGCGIVSGQGDKKFLREAERVSEYVLLGSDRDGRTDFGVGVGRRHGPDRTCSISRSTAACRLWGKHLLGNGRHQQNPIVT